MGICKLLHSRSNIARVDKGNHGSQHSQEEHRHYRQVTLKDRRGAFCDENGGASAASVRLRRGNGPRDRLIRPERSFDQRR